MAANMIDCQKCFPNATRVTDGSCAKASIEALQEIRIKHGGY
jgi:hypothetical protein